jgi:hypothetical protein
MHPIKADRCCKTSIIFTLSAKDMQNQNGGKCLYTPRQVGANIPQVSQPPDERQLASALQFEQQAFS